MPGSDKTSDRHNQVVHFIYQSSCPPHTQNRDQVEDPLHTGSSQGKPPIQENPLGR